MWGIFGRQPSHIQYTVLLWWRLYSGDSLPFSLTFTIYSMLCHKLYTIKISSRIGHKLDSIKISSRFGHIKISSRFGPIKSSSRFGHIKRQTDWSTGLLPGSNHSNVSVWILKIAGVGWRNGFDFDIVAVFTSDYISPLWAIGRGWRKRCSLYWAIVLWTVSKSSVTNIHNRYVYIVHHRTEGLKEDSLNSVFGVEC